MTACARCGAEGVELATAEGVEGLVCAECVPSTPPDSTGETLPEVKPEESGEKKTKPPQSAILLALAREAGATCFATPAGEPFVTIRVGEHVEHHRLGSRASRDYLARLFYESEEKAPSAQALQDALGVLRGEALFGGGERVEVHVRHAATDTAIYVDLGATDWSAVEIDAEGWRIVANPPVRFRRARGMLPLPLPVRGGSLDGLRELLNVGGERDWRLIVGYLVGALAPAGPYPILALYGEQGAAKSSAARLVRSLLDPSTAPLRSEPRDEHDLVIAASNGRIVALDNLSRLPASLSDALCRLATGGGFATRELYSDSEEIIFAATRPAILTAIAEVATRGDLLDRSIVVTLAAIPEAARLTEAELDERWNEVAPAALGVLLEAASTALRRRGEVRLQRLPRMADHAVWVEAAAPALGWRPGEYLEAYAEARAASVETALDSSPLTAPIRELAEEGFAGSATELLAVLEGLVGESVTRRRGWPGSPRALSGELRKLASDLRSAGIEVEFDAREGRDRRRVLRIEQAGISPSAPSAPSAPARKPLGNGESGADANADANEGATANADGADAKRFDLRPRSNGSVEPNLAPADAADAKNPPRSTRGCVSHRDNPAAGCRYCRAIAEAA